MKDWVYIHETTECVSACFITDNLKKGEFTDFDTKEEAEEYRAWDLGLLDLT